GRTCCWPGTLQVRSSRKGSLRPFDTGSRIAGRRLFDVAGEEGASDERRRHGVRKRSAELVIGSLGGVEAFGVALYGGHRHGVHVSSEKRFGGVGAEDRSGADAAAEIAETGEGVLAEPDDLWNIIAGHGDAATPCILEFGIADGGKKLPQLAPGPRVMDRRPGPSVLPIPPTIMRPAPSNLNEDMTSAVSQHPSPPGRMVLLADSGSGAVAN